MSIFRNIKSFDCKNKTVTDEQIAITNITILCKKKGIEILNIAYMGKDEYFVVPVHKVIVFDNTIHGYLFNATLNTIIKHDIYNAMKAERRLKWLK